MLREGIATDWKALVFSNRLGSAIVMCLNAAADTNNLLQAGGDDTGEAEHASGSAGAPGAQPAQQGGGGAGDELPSMLSSMVEDMLASASECVPPLDLSLDLRGVQDLLLEEPVDAEAALKAIRNLFTGWRFQPRGSPIHALHAKYDRVLKEKLRGLGLAQKSTRYSVYHNPAPFASAAQAASAAKALMADMIPKLRGLERRGGISWLFALRLNMDGGTVWHGASQSLPGIHSTLNTVAVLAAYSIFAHQARAQEALAQMHDPSFGSLSPDDAVCVVKLLLRIVVPKHQHLYPFSKGDTSFSEFKKKYDWWPDVPYAKLSSLKSHQLEAVFDALCSAARSQWGLILKEFRSVSAPRMNAHSASEYTLLVVTTQLA
jgi:hypothetical protein